MTAEEMLNKVQELKEESVMNSFDRPVGLEQFFNENWMQILDILDDALFEYLKR